MRIEIPRAVEEFRPEFPMEFTIGQFETRVVRFPAGRDGRDIRVTTERDRAIHVFTRNDAKLDIIGVNDEDRSTDAFLALPCKLGNPPAEGRRFYTSSYKYFTFSASDINNNAYIMIIPCTEGDPVRFNYDITQTRPGRTPNDVVDLLQYEIALIDSSEDLTGTIIESSYPLAVFAIHQCGEIPEGVVACDQLVEQIPPHITYGTRFFVLPYAVRESGDIIRVGSVLDDNEVNVTCTAREVDGTLRMNTESATINTGGNFTYRTHQRSLVPGLTSDDYRRDFCCIETSKPAIVMQYMIGHNVDRVDFEGLGQAGDPAMSLVPPVEQYRNNYIITTADEVADDTGNTRFEFASFMGWAIASEFFNPDNNDTANFRVDNTTFMPTDRSSGGSGTYVEIFCSSGEVCGYGAFGRLESGIRQVSYENPSRSNVAMYTTVYGLQREISYAYPAGIECEPIGSE